LDAVVIYIVALQLQYIAIASRLAPPISFMILLCVSVRGTHLVQRRSVASGVRWAEVSCCDFVAAFLAGEEKGSGA